MQLSDELLELAGLLEALPSLARTFRQDLPWKHVEMAFLPRSSPLVLEDTVARSLIFHDSATINSPTATADHTFPLP